MQEKSEKKTLLVASQHFEEEGRARSLPTSGQKAIQGDGERFQQYFRLTREQFARVLFFVEDGRGRHSWIPWWNSHSHGSRHVAIDLFASHTACRIPHAAANPKTDHRNHAHTIFICLIFLRHTALKDS